MHNSSVSHLLSKRGDTYEDADADTLAERANIVGAELDSVDGEGGDGNQGLDSADDEGEDGPVAVRVRKQSTNMFKLNQLPQCHDVDHGVSLSCHTHQRGVACPLVTMPPSYHTPQRGVA